MAEHAKLSPSHAPTWMTCAGALALSEGMPSPSSPYAAEGTRAHATAEALLRGTMSPDKLAPEQQDLLVYTRHIAELTSAPGATCHVEIKVNITQHCWGTADAIVWAPESRTLYVRDLKWGAGVAVGVRDNLQLKLYALGALLTMRYPAKIVNVGIVQPRMPHEDGQIRSVDYDSADLLDFHADVQDAAAKVRDAFYQQGEMAEADWIDAYLKPSEKACRWCLAAPKCPKLTAQAQAVCKATFSPVLAYDPAQLAAVLDQIPLIEAYCKNVRQFAYDEAEAGRVPPTYKLVEKRAARRWRDDVNRFQLAEQLDVKFADILKPQELLPVGDIVKLCPGKNAAEREAYLADYTVKESSGHTLVHESDKREPVRVEAKAAFQVVDRELK